MDNQNVNNNEAYINKTVSINITQKMQSEDGFMKPWDGKVRLMENSNISLPYSVAFVIKKLEKFDSIKSTIDAKMTMIMRIKFAGLDKLKSVEHMKEVMEHCKTKLKTRVNEEEEVLLKPNDPNFKRSGTWKLAKSSEYTSDKECEDMLTFTIRGITTISTDFDHYK